MNHSIKYCKKCWKINIKLTIFSKLSYIIEESRSRPTREVIIAVDFNGRTEKQIDSQIDVYKRQLLGTEGE